MPGLYEYTIQMNDRASGTLQRLTGTSFETVQRLTQLQERTQSLQLHTADFGNSISSLRQRIDLLQAERDLIDPSNMTTIRQYNREINTLNRNIQQLETTTSGNRLSTYARDAFSQIPGADMLTNPLVLAGAGIAAVGKLGMDWETGMAKINTTARLSEDELDKLGSTIKKMGVDAGGDLMKVPIAYEKILSQTNNVALSTDILGISLKGAKAGFTDLDIVSGAAAQSLSAIGEGKATAAEVMDTLFAAKRVGAGEFVDFANNIPGLIASGKNVGVTWKEVSGAFAYMTGQGNNAADSTMLLQNAFSALGKSEITGGLKAAGVAVFDNTGKMRGLADIMTDLSGLTKTMSDQQKSDFFEAIGLKDQQAKQAFSNLTNDAGKLKEAMNATGNAAGELQSALDQTNTPANKIKEIWSNITGTGLGLSDVLKAVLNPALVVLLFVFKGIYAVVEAVGSVWDSWTGKLSDGSNIIYGITTAVTALTLALTSYNLVQKGVVLWEGFMTIAKSSGVYGWYAYATAIEAVNIAWAANPVGFIIGGLVLVASLVYAAWQKFEGFRKVVMGVGYWLKSFGTMIKDYVLDRITGILKGLGGIASAIGKLFRGDFSGALQDGKEALMNLTPANAVLNAIESGKKLGQAFEEGKAAGAVSWANDHYKENDKGFRVTQSVEPTSQLKGAPTADWNSMIYGDKGKVSPLMSTATQPVDEKKKSAQDLLDKTNVDLKVNPVLDKTKTSDSLSLGIPQNYNPTNDYGAIAAKFGIQADLAISDKNKATNPTEKPIINMASRVDEIAGSLRKIAAVAALPVMMTIGAASTSSATTAAELNPVVNNNHITDARNMVEAPVANTTNQDNAIYNAFDNRLFKNSQQITDLSQKISSTSSLTENSSTRSITANTDLSRKESRSTSSLTDISTSSMTNTDLSRKMEQVSSTSSLTGDTNNISNADLSRKVSSISSLTDISTSSMTNTDLSRKIIQSNSQLETSFANSVANTDMSRKMEQVSSTSSQTDISTNSMTNTDLSRKIIQSNSQLETSFANSVANTDMSRKMEQVSSTSSLTRDTNNTSNTDLSRKVNQSSTQLENSFANSVINTDLSRKIDQISNLTTSSTSSPTDNSLFSNTTETANSYDGSRITNSDVTNSAATQTSVSTTNSNQGRTVHFDRFTDKIEIHVSGVDDSTGSAIAEQIRNEVEKALAEILNV